MAYAFGWTPGMTDTQAAAKITFASYDYFATELFDDGDVVDADVIDACELALKRLSKRRTSC